MAPQGVPFFLLSFAICTSVGHARPPSKIINGTVATNIPYQVSIRHHSHSCAGSIIDERHILTAAHCYPAQTVLIGTNDKDNQDPECIYRVVNITVHPERNRQQFLNDIAILTLDRKILFNEYQRSILLPEKDTAENSSVNYSGWGYTSYRGSSPRYLQESSGKVINDFECALWMFPTEITKNHICFATKQGGVCDYDSGGPLVHDSVLVGVISFSRWNCDTKYPNVATRVYNFVPWIRKVINESYDLPEVSSNFIDIS